MQTTNRSVSGNTSCHPRLRELLDKNEFDWENLRHRETYLHEWIHGRLADYRTFSWEAQEHRKTTGQPAGNI